MIHTRLWDRQPIQQRNTVASAEETEREIDGMKDRLIEGRTGFLC